MTQETKGVILFFVAWLVIVFLLGEVFSNSTPPNYGQYEPQGIDEKGLPFF